MEIVRYEVAYWEGTDPTEQTDTGWAFGSDLADVTNQILVIMVRIILIHSKLFAWKNVTTLCFPIGKPKK